MKEDKADKILDLLETAFTSFSGEIKAASKDLSTKIDRNAEAINRNAKAIDRNANLIQGLQRGLDDTRFNYTKIESHVALKEGVEEIAKHQGLDLDLSAA